VDTLPVNFKAIYQAAPAKDGVVRVPDEDYRTMTKMALGTKEGSADRSPVIFSDIDDVRRSCETGQLVNGAGIVFARGLLVDYEGGQLISQAKIALTMAGSLWKRNDEGAWIAIRFLDVLPGIGDVLETIRNWVAAIKNAIDSIVDTIIKYIEWLEARIVELQQLIRRINALIQSLLGHLFQVPACSALMCIAPGTDGLLSAFLSSQYKPDDGPFAYGAGVALVIPFLPSFAYQLLLQLFKMVGLLKLLKRNVLIEKSMENLL